MAFVDARLQIDGTDSLTIASAVNERTISPQIYIENTFIDFRTDPAQQIVRFGGA